MRRFLIGLLAVIGALSILAVCATLVLVLVFASSGPRLPARAFLEIDTERGLVERVSGDPFDALMNEQAPSVLDVVSALDRAAGDRRVVGVVARIGSTPFGLARIQELRDAVLRFRESGKPALAWSDTFGEVGPGNGAYYLATAFDEIHLQPSGDVGLTGLHYQVPFMAGTFEKLAIEPQMEQRHEYKNAMNSYTERGFTAAHREALQALADAQFGQIVAGVAAARGLDESVVRALADRGPLLAGEALEAGLVDGLAYRDEIYERLRELGPRARPLYPDRYVDIAGGAYDRGERIALIYGVGGIVRGRGGYDPFSGERAMGADAVAAAFRAAIADRRVKAILFRLDCPGGSYVASDTVWRETIRAREAGKPVIVSMGDVAGSGGYFVAMDAHTIVAQPATITASIGVYGGKLVTGGLWEKLGLTFDDVTTGDNARIWDSVGRFSPGEYERFREGLDRVYEDFTARVADGRGLPLERVRELARGRIWSGEQALELGLVDRLGGFATALAAAREAAGLDEGRALRLVAYPRERSLWESLFGEPRRSGDEASTAAVREALRGIQPLVRGARALGVVPKRPATLAMPPLPRPE